MNGYKWFPCELHCHTVNSDGNFTVKELMETAVSRGIKGICLTDHNTTSGWEDTEKYPAPAVLKGIEWTTYFGHMLVLDCKGYVDWRDAVPDNIDEKVEAVRKNGGIAGIAHPFQLGTPVCTGGHWDYNVKKWENITYMEIWSEGSPFLNSANRRAIKLWESLLDKGYKIAATFGRDWHRPDGNLCPTACTYLLCPDGELTGEKMKNALVHGRTAVSKGPLFFFETDDGKKVGDTVSPGRKKLSFTAESSGGLFVPSEVRVITNGGKEVLRARPGETVQLELMPESWYRAELWGAYGENGECQLAVTSPMYTSSF